MISPKNPRILESVGIDVRVLITGCCGFIGSHLTSYLVRRGYSVYCIDNLSRATKESIEVVKECNIVYKVVDITDSSRIVEHIRRFRSNVLVHLAALVDAEESIRKPDLYAYVNVYGTSVVVGKALEYGVERVVYISSAAVYGEPKRLPISEEHPVEPVNPYGVTKLAGEHLVRVMCELTRKPYVVLRLFNVYGPRQNPSYAGVVVKTLERIAAEKPPVVYGDGMQTRDMVYVGDVVEAIEKAIETQYVDEVYNIGSGEPVRIRDLINLILELTGKEELKPVHAPPRPGDIRHSYADISKARKMLGFKPKTSLREGLAKTIEWYMGRKLSRVE